ncbi:uncharacterized protein FTOL_01246 [Fusarium torulosum]|uniref:Uncharacterized protein n=1 Tax=Fusarium torulosum TaxID=33205 RepID=A0AAE8SD86_9HYPO|nr:uncharacterized protein FTOL_01246 [Fusarium torulosum]
MSPSSSSPSRDITELFSRRRGINIPSDQKNLLDGPGSWAVELNNQPHSRAHIPGHVLETVKASYIARKVTLQDRKPQAKKRGASPGPFTRSKRIRNGDTPIPTADHENSPASSPERLLSWEPSRSPTPVPKDTKDSESIAVLIGPTTQSSIIHETPKTGSVPPVNDPSSSEEVDDLETRIPDAQPHLNVLVNRMAVPANPTVPSPLSTDRTMATPPCAQPSNPTQALVRDTVITHKRACEENRSPRTSQPKPRLRFKPIGVGDMGKKRKKGHNEKERLPPTIMPPKIESSQLPTSSDSFIPNTYNHNGPMTRELIRESIEGNEEDETADNVEEIVPSTYDQSLIVDSPSTQHRRPAIKLEPLEMEQRAPNKDKQAAQEPITPLQMGPSKMLPSSTSHRRLGDQLQPSTPLYIAPGPPLKPYDVFVQQYPAYTGDDDGRKLPGTKRHFITACVYLNYLRPKRLLRDCLYDDFIRAFPCYYKKYVDRTGVSVMVAIDWFNKQKGPPVFNKYLVNRSNLSHILRSYPEEFAQVNKLYSRKDGDEVKIYTSSGEEGDMEESRRLSSSVSRPSNHSHQRKSVESLQPITTVESDMEIDLPEMLPALRGETETRTSDKASTTLFIQVPEDLVTGPATTFFTSSWSSNSGAAAALAQYPTDLNVAAIHSWNVSDKAKIYSTVKEIL